MEIGLTLPADGSAAPSSPSSATRPAPTAVYPPLSPRKSPQPTTSVPVAAPKSRPINAPAVPTSSASLVTARSGRSWRPGGDEWENGQTAFRCSAVQSEDEFVGYGIWRITSGRKYTQITSAAGFMWMPVKRPGITRDYTPKVSRQSPFPIHHKPQSIDDCHQAGTRRCPTASPSAPTAPQT